MPRSTPSGTWPYRGFTVRYHRSRDPLPGTIAPDAHWWAEISAAPALGILAAASYPALQALVEMAIDTLLDQDSPPSATTAHGLPDRGVPPGVARIPLNHGKWTLIDADDLPRVAPFRWYAVRDDDRWFAKRGVNLGPMEGRRICSIYLHHVILAVPPGTWVTHLNRDTLDNRKANLRIITRHEAQGRRRLSRNNTSGYRGVSYHKATGKWRANIRKAGMKQSLGYFATPEEAARAYDVAAQEEWGDLALLNLSAESGEG